MVDDMEFHGRAWFEILTVRLGAGLTEEQVKHQMYGRNDELLKRVFGANRFTPQELEELGLEKERLYQKEYLPHLQLLPGLFDLLVKASNARVRMAIGSAALPLNIDFILDTLNIRHYFHAVISAVDVVNSKPDPETYTLAAAQLGLPAAECLVFEDAPKGVECAQNAGMDAVVLTTTHPKEDFASYPNVVRFADDFRDGFIGSLV